MKNAVIQNGVVTNLILGVVSGVQIVADDGTAQIGWTFDGTNFVPPAVDPVVLAEQTRLAAVDSAISSDAVILSLKAMDTAAFDTWWAANVTNAAQAINILKRLTRVVIRRVL